MAREAVAVAPNELEPQLELRLVSSTGDTLTVQVVKGRAPAVPETLLYIRGRGAFELLRREVWSDKRVRLTLAAWPRSDRGVILVVEDNSDIRDMVAEALEMDGYRVETAPNGSIALEQVRVSRPHIIVLDLMMPVMTGWQLLEALRQVPELASVPVVVVTALEDARPEGAVAFVRKPFSLETLLATVAWASGGGRSTPTS